MARAGYTENYCQLVPLEVLPCPRKERGEEGGKNVDSQRGSHSARNWATAMGRIQGLIPKIVSITRNWLWAQCHIPRVSSLTSVVLMRGMMFKEHLW